MSLAKSLGVKWTPYIAQEPTAKQLAFLLLPHREALFGGAAGGGKSSALLMAALQYVDVPGYAALIFRKTLTDLKQPNALLDRAHAWLQGTPAKYDGSNHKYVFPTFDDRGNPSIPATLSFGFIGDQNQFLRYNGIEVQFCAFDEVTQHQEEHYRYLFSRLRKLVCPIHKTDSQGRPIYVKGCYFCDRQSSLPLRMRAATNPGGPGGAWVKRRFQIQPHISNKEAAEQEKRTGQKIKQRWIGKAPFRPFIPSFATDNPFLNIEEYGVMLDELDPATREQLKEGRWDVSANAQFQRRWAKYYTRRGPYFVLGEDGGNQYHVVEDILRIFAVVDPAVTTKHGPGDTDTWRKDPSFTVIGVFALTTDYNLLWLDLVRFRRQSPEVIKAIIRVHKTWNPQYFVIEANGVGSGIYQTAMREGMVVKPIHSRRDKLDNATEAMLRMEQSRIWFPQVASWLNDVEDEIFYWTGDPRQTDDIVDVLSNAARDVTWDDSQVFAKAADPSLRTYAMPAPGFVDVRGTGVNPEYAALMKQLDVGWDPDAFYPY